MGIHALVSVGGSPGVTTAALSLALTWPRPVAIVECDPSGGDILAGFFAGHLAAQGGLLSAAFEASRGHAAVAAEIERQFAPLDSGSGAVFLAGFSDPRQAVGLAPAWPVIARTLAERYGDVIADCGRLDAGDAQPTSLLAESVAVILVLRSSLRQVAAARPRVKMISQLLGGTTHVGLLLIADGGHAGHRGPSPKEIASALAVPVLASLPYDVRTAAVLSDGDGARTSLDARPLLRAARTAGQAISQFGRPDQANNGFLPVAEAGSLP